MFDVVNSRRDLLTRNLTHHAHPSIQAQHLQLCSGNLQRRDMLASGRRRPVLISSSGTAQKEPAHGGIVKKTSQRKERRAACESWCWSAGPGICLAPEHGSAAGWSSLPLRWGRQARAQGRGGLCGLVWCASCPEAEILRLSRELREEGKKSGRKIGLFAGEGGDCVSVTGLPLVGMREVVRSILEGLLEYYYFLGVGEYVHDLNILMACYFFNLIRWRKRNREV